MFSFSRSYLKRQSFHVGLLTLLVLVIMGCHSKPVDVKEVAELPVIWPDYVGVTIPTDIAPLNFSMADDEVESVDVEVKGSKTGSIPITPPISPSDLLK